MHDDIPFDLYELRLIRLVAEERGFTRAARRAGITQSALTRQVQGVEERLGTALFHRSTRKVALTSAGEFLLAKTESLARQLRGTVEELGARFMDAPRRIRVGITRSISLAHLPGFFYARAEPGSLGGTLLTRATSAEILSRLEDGGLDVGVLGRPGKIPRSLRVTHGIRDTFVLIAPFSAPPPPQAKSWTRDLRRWLSEQTWITLERGSGTAEFLRQWLEARALDYPAAMELDTFDLVVALVSLGLGVGLVPRRALAIFPRKKSLRVLSLPERPEREIVVLVRRQKQLPMAVASFLERILFTPASAQKASRPKARKC